ncbi:hypothetical protein MKZ38_002600 [Zalerion maritima]|uniref:Uncharacterized protein n=1 Tax=Zalerion maritima TaxID=339359 RepID=A0AAD5RQ00_9PEZI|nr:hypothetical protein MKZ38_002600 [Zalerion maritima]
MHFTTTSLVAAAFAVSAAGEDVSIPVPRNAPRQPHPLSQAQALFAADQALAALVRRQAVDQIICADPIPYSNCVLDIVESNTCASLEDSEGITACSCNSALDTLGCYYSYCGSSYEGEPWTSTETYVYTFCGYYPDESGPDAGVEDDITLVTSTRSVGSSEPTETTSSGSGDDDDDDDDNGDPRDGDVTETETDSSEAAQDARSAGIDLQGTRPGGGALAFWIATSIMLTIVRSEAVVA